MAFWRRKPADEKPKGTEGKLPEHKLIQLPFDEKAKGIRDELPKDYEILQEPHTSFLPGSKEIQYGGLAKSIPIEFHTPSRYKKLVEQCREVLDSYPQKIHKDSSPETLRKLFRQFNVEIRDALELPIDADRGIHTGHEAVGDLWQVILLDAMDKRRGIVFLDYFWYGLGEHAVAVIGAENGAYVLFDQASGTIKTSRISYAVKIRNEADRRGFTVTANPPVRVLFTEALDQEFMRLYGGKLAEIHSEAERLMDPENGVSTKDAEKRLAELFTAHDQLRVEFIETHFKPPRVSLGLIQEISGDCGIGAVFSALVYSELEKAENHRH